MLTRHIRESLQVTPGPFPDFWVGPGDKARGWARDYQNGGSFLVYGIVITC